VILETPRLYLTHTPLIVLQTRLQCDDFSMFVPDLGFDVHFPPDHPGPDALEHLPGWIAHMQQHGQPADQPGGCVVHKLERRAVGGIGFKGEPDETSSIEIGYGMNASHHGQGLATEAVGALVSWALESGFVRRVTAETLETNLASGRVLEKNGFTRFGERFDADEGGNLILWERLKL
jgi:[ribosomal protein S5]-alanine N-acetyltransferase